MIPILLNHDRARPIGTVREDDGRLLVEFTEEMQMTREMFMETFGNVGAHILQTEVKGGIVIIRKAHILEFSFSPEFGGAKSVTPLRPTTPEQTEKKPAI